MIDDQTQWYLSSTFWTAASTFLIAGFTAALFVLQRRQHKHDIKVSNTNYRLALHEKRIEIITAVEEFVGDFYRSGEPDLHKAAEMMFRLRDADLLFPPEALTAIREFRTKAGEYHVLKARVEHLNSELGPFLVWDAAEPRPTEEEITKRHNKVRVEIAEKHKEMHEIGSWVLAQTEGQRDDIKWLKPLREHMKLPPSLD
jgi:hypothetical protein